MHSLLLPLLFVVSNTLFRNVGSSRYISRTRKFASIHRSSFQYKRKGKKLCAHDYEHQSIEYSSSPMRCLQRTNFFSVRGGGGNERNTQIDDENRNDEDRYSRQLFTLGARAHKLVRSTNILLDGPFSSGLTYECAKNLALSGVGGITLLLEENADENNSNSLKYLHESYQCESKMDDLGRAYKNASRNENNASIPSGSVEERVMLMEYLSRLNPSVKLSIIKKSELSKEELGSSFIGENPVFLCVDRPQTTQLTLSKLCRNLKVPFISVESRGVYGRIFCDFGDDFFVQDEDGETPKETLFLKAVLMNTSEAVSDKEDTDQRILLEIHCVEGEKHDVSQGDVIEFQFAGDESCVKQGMPIFSVLNVKSPTCFTVVVNQNASTDDDNSLRSAATSVISSISDAMSFKRVKLPHHVPFLPMHEALDIISSKNSKESLFAASDLDKSFDMTRQMVLMASFAALGEFASKYHRLPVLDTQERDVTLFCDIVNSNSNSLSKLKGEKQMQYLKIAQSFAKCAAATLAPVQALMGALASQEALKAASGLYNPIRQFLLYDCDELLQHTDGATHTSSAADDDCIATGQSYVLGSLSTKAIASHRIFVVGSGAIGCEILKNLSAMGAATSSSQSRKGCIVLTDMDTIERSNLSRQLLFRDGDVGKFKSLAAQEAIQKFNPSAHMETYTDKVGGGAGSGNIFDKPSFWSDDIDIILNALDNVEARLYMDQRCVEYRKGMVDAGTLGSKGNVQVVVPLQSESYGSSMDPPEPAIPVCTLKNFPYEISHTIQWGRDLFDGLFHRRPMQAKAHLDELLTHSISDNNDERLEIVGKSLIKKLGEDSALTAAEEIAEDLTLALMGKDVSSRVNSESVHSFLDTVKAASLQWAVCLFERLFRDSINTLLEQNAPDSVDDDGNPFWSGVRRMPKIIKFDLEAVKGLDKRQLEINRYIIQFIQSAFRLRVESYVPKEFLQGNFSRCTEEDVVDALKSRIWQVNERDDRDSRNNNDDILSLIVTKLKRVSTEVPKQHYLQVAEFEKDDDSNGHVAFVTAASNLRAIIYSIPPTSAMETRRIAGRIVPAMITTTAFVSALSCIELIKLVMKFPLKLHRNAFVNLALPFFAFTQPLPADKFVGLHGKTHTLWDRIVIKEKKNHLKPKHTEYDEDGQKITSHMGGSGMTLKYLIRQLNKKIGADAVVSTISYGPYMIYANFIHGVESSVLNKCVWGLIKEALISGDDADDIDSDGEATKDLSDSQLSSIHEFDKRTFFDLSVVVEEDATGEEAELPPVRIVKWKREKVS